MDLVVLYKWTAIISGAAFLLQLAATLFGFDDIFGDHADASGAEGADLGGADGHGFGHVFLSFLSVRNVICFLLAFSVTGYYGITTYNLGGMATPLGIVAGLALVFLNIYMMRALSGLKRDTTVRESELPGRRATVVFPVLPKRSGQGKVNVTVDGRTMTLFALTDEAEELPRNAAVVIEQVLEGWVILVRKP